MRKRLNSNGDVEYVALEGKVLSEEEFVRLQKERKHKGRKKTANGVTD